MDHSFFLPINPPKKQGIIIVSFIAMCIYTSLLMFSGIIEWLYGSLHMSPPFLAARSREWGWNWDWVDNTFIGNKVYSLMPYLFLIFPFLGCCLILTIQDLNKNLKTMFQSRKRYFLISGLLVTLEMVFVDQFFPGNLGIFFLAAVGIWTCAYAIYPHIGFLMDRYFVALVRVLYRTSQKRNRLRP
jgi:hypothetical protein